MCKKVYDRMKYAFLLCCLTAIITYGCAASNKDGKRIIIRFEDLPNKELFHDPIEDSPEYRSILPILDSKVDELLTDHPMRGGVGFCYVFWKAKKDILFEEYGLYWRSPADMNRQILFY